MIKKLFLTSVSLCLILGAVATSSQAQGTLARQKKLIVGTKEAPPFSMKNPDGSWKGISIDLFKEIAHREHLIYDIQEYDLAGLLDAVKTKKVDVAVAALTITPEREKYLDFSHAFYVEGLGIAVKNFTSRGWLFGVKRFVSFKFLSVIGVLALVLLFFGFLLWIFERKGNPEQFDQKPVKGLLDGFWWSAVTMTTVGYGDKYPKTFGGRLVGLIWMFTAIIIISSFTAAITSSITVSQLESSINGPDDLVKVDVATVKDSAIAEILRDRGIRCQYFDTLQEALEQLEEDNIDAVVYDAPLLQYVINNKFKDYLRVLPQTFIDQPYGLAFPSDYALREKINQMLLEVINSSQWQDILERYLGTK